MYILRSAITPTGSRPTVHRISAVEIVNSEPFNGLDNFVFSVTVNSYENATAETIWWQERLNIPMVAFTAEQFPYNLLFFLIAPNGYLAGGEIVNEEVSILDRKKIILRTQINQLRDQIIWGGFDYEGLGGVDSDSQSIENIRGASQSAAVAKLLGEPWEKVWRLEDNSAVTLDADGMIALARAMEAHITACYAHSWELKAQLDAVTDEAQLDGGAIFTVGWPQREDVFAPVSPPIIEPIEIITPEPTSDGSDLFVPDPEPTADGPEPTMFEPSPHFPPVADQPEPTAPPVADPWPVINTEAG